MKKRSIILILMLVSICSVIIPMHTRAEEQIDYNAIYNQAIKEGVIKQQDLSYDDWLKENVEFKKIYDAGINENVLDPTLGYAEWIKLNHYGQPPADDNTEFTTYTLGSTKTKATMLSTSTSNIKVTQLSSFRIKPGDILITNSTSSNGIVGHSAIANGANHILDMPGYGNKSDNNRQLTVSQWLSKYNHGWIKVYRLKDSSMAAKVARYADRNFYSSNGSSTKNIHIAYKIDRHLYQKSPSYCSKLVYDAYYYGSGSASVVRAQHGYVMPYDLPGVFTAKYRPSMVHQY
ncbi:hypothetical protein [Bacillus subtilis]|uniref:hypothetical protein n=1 Tax=Bacillus subtilis TaxID=1423 RepID=UPI00059E0F59|nr:hypothetical protein [Bacillus subtilis]KIN30881.1 hypothetical protein B4069_2954 [Bacillus subtilis]KIN46718.1 hypothetical protein B4072_2947 [Bacillus subtilis]